MGAPEEVKRGGVASMGEALSTYLKVSGLERKVADLAVFQAWNESAGPALAERAKPVRFKMAILTVEVVSAAHFHELANFKGEQLRKLVNRRLGASRVRRIDFKLKQ